jgi:Arc/MetJ-type ribon-helix-helix transcriptional regulator
MSRRQAWQQYEREWLRKQAIERRYEHIFKGNDAGHHASVAADLLVESGEFRSRQEALRHLLTTAHGAAHLQRLRTSKKGTAMDATVKIAKGIADSGRSWLTEHELTSKIEQYALRDRLPNETQEQAFARHFTANDEEGRLFRKAVQVAKATQLQNTTSYPWPVR